MGTGALCHQSFSRSASMRDETFSSVVAQLVQMRTQLCDASIRD